MGLRLNNSYFRLSNGIFRSVEPVVSSGGVVLSYTVTELLTTTGAGTWTKPAGITSITVECWGGGGAGGGGILNPAGGAGGAGGQYARKVITYGSAQQNISYAVGAGGVASQGNGLSGSSSTWNTTDVVAVGGAGGIANATIDQIVPGGVGSTIGGIGDIVYPGGTGTDGFSFGPAIDQAYGGSGGGGAGSLGPGNNPIDGVTGGAASSELGGAGGNGVITAAAAINGNPGSNYGGGGGGGATFQAANASGGAGAQGLIRVRYTAPPPLDLYTGSSAAFSVRKLTASASFCMKVRRSSDNATQDIGFQDDGMIDTGSLLSFVGSNTGYVNIWYNQANDTDNAFVPPATTIQEPYIVLNGSLMTMNGKPAVFYNALAGIFSTTTKLTDASGLWSTYAVGQVADTTTRLMVRTNTGATNIGQNIRRNGTNIESIGFNTVGGTGTDLGPSNPGTSQFVAYSQRTAANVEVYVNGATNGATAVAGTPQTSTGSNGSVFLGFFGGSGPPTFPWTGSIQEVIHYAQSPTTFDYRANLTSQINSFYGTF